MSTLKFVSALIVLALLLVLTGNAVQAQTPEPNTFQLNSEVAKALIAATVKATKMSEADLLKEILSGKTLASVIKDKGGDVNAVKKEAQDAVAASIKQAVSAGKLTQAQADALTARLDTVLTGALNTERFAAARANNLVGTVVDAVLNAVADATKLDRAEIVRQTATGKTLAALLKEKGADVDKVKASIKANLTAEIDAAKASGAITPAAAQRLLNNLDQSINNALNNPIRGPQASPGAANNAVMRVVEGTAVTVLIQETAKQTNLAQREVLAQLRAGKTLNEITTANKADHAKIIEAATKTLTNRLTQLSQRNNRQLPSDALQQALKGMPDLLKRLMDTKNPAQLGQRNQ